MKRSYAYQKHRKEFCEKCGYVELAAKAEYDSEGFLIRKGRRDRNYMTVHHIDHNPRNNKLSNLQTLCRFCHNKIHAIIHV